MNRKSSEISDKCIKVKDSVGGPSFIFMIVWQSLGSDWHHDLRYIIYYAKHKYLCVLPSRPLPEYGDMDPSCGLTDDRACK